MNKLLFILQTFLKGIGVSVIVAGGIAAMVFLLVGLTMWLGLIGFIVWFIVGMATLYTVIECSDFL